MKTALPLLLSAGVMGGISYGFYWVLTRWISPRIAVLPAIILAIVVYAVCVVLFRGVSYDDVVMLPKGQTLARLLRMKPEEVLQVLPGEEAAQSLPAAETAPQADPSPRASVREKRSRRGKYTPRHMR